MQVWDLPAETVDVRESLGRVTARAVAARISSPSYHASAMDGYAVRFADTFGASETTPLRLELGSQAIYIDTGDPMPEGGFNAVVMVEDVSVSGEFVEIIAALTPWQNVRTVGEDIVATEFILPENHVIRPVDLAAMLAGGHTEVKVRVRPKVAIIPTGSELVEPGTELKAGNVIDYNSHLLSALVTQWGGEPLRFGIVPDDREKLKAAIKKAASEADIIAVNAGASAGSMDYTAEVAAQLGEVLTHGVSIKPGKPIILGLLNDPQGGKQGKPFLGVPGYPVSAYLTFDLFARPVVYGRLGLVPEEVEPITAVLSRQAASSMGQEEFIRVKLGKVGDRLIATPLGRGAGMLMSLQRADGIMRVPAMSEGPAAGAQVLVTPLRSAKEIQNTIVAIGSHDNTLDLLSNALKVLHPGLTLSSAHVGSMGGLVALKRAEAHMAPTHLLDEQTGQYNVAFIKKLLPDKKIMLINLVYREQGLMVLAGNPKGIKGFGDLVAEGITFINRQRGAGTRLLLDKHLSELGIDPKDINGYNNDEYTHMAVASAVSSNMADTGLGILSAALALGLDFIPVAKERYDIAIPGEFIDTPKLKALLGVIQEDKQFKAKVKAMGGYDVSDMGKVMWESEG